MSAYLPILLLGILATGFLLASTLLSSVMQRRRPNPAKGAPYECGIVPDQEPAERFPVKFYLVAISFVVLDIEIIFLYPFATVFRRLGGFGIAAIGVFLLVLLVPFAYLISTGALNWGSMRRLGPHAAAPVRRAKEASGVKPEGEEAAA